MLIGPLRASLVGLAALALLPGPALAQGDWYIDDFHSEITIQADSGFDVVETIRVNFQQPHHGIYRQLPILYSYDQTRDRVYHVDVRSVTDQNGRPWPYATSDVGPYRQIKIGSAGSTLTGVQVYRIAYHVLGAMNAFSDHDELYWNVNGADWAVPTSSVSATVHAPAGSVTQTACYEGAAGSTESCVQSPSAEQGASFAAQHGFQPGQQLTIVVGLRKGAVAAPPVFLQDKPRTADPSRWFDLNPGSLLLSLLVLAVGLGVLARQWARRRQHQAMLRHPPLVVEFEPPQALHAAQLGVIVDDSADPRDVTATIIDLAVRGYLGITEIPKAAAWTQADWMLTRTAKPEDDLQPYERTILDGLFSGAGQVYVSSLRDHFYTTLNTAEQQLYGDAVKRGWYFNSPAGVRQGYIGCGFVLLFIAGFITLGLGNFLGYGLVGVALGVVGIVTMVASRLMPVKTAAGTDVFQKTLGFRLYMNTAERYRQQFAEKAEIFTQLLPYAIVFGCVSGWARAFAGLDTNPATASWYRGSAPLQAAALSATLQGFDSQVSTFIASTPAARGSSGFGGGGFSGGGGGGGGGGAW